MFTKILRRTLMISTACLLLPLAGTVSAALVKYEISSTTGISTGLPLFNDAVVDLLDLPTATSLFPASFALIVDTNSVPFVINNNSGVQQTIYDSAIVSAEINLNGVIFNTKRSLVPSPQTNSPALGEGVIELLKTSTGTGTGTSIFSIDINRTSPNPALFNDFTVPFNQTISGVFYDDALIELDKLLMFSDNDNLVDGINLPSVPGPSNLFGSTLIQLGVTLLSNSSGTQLPAGIIIGFDDTFPNYNAQISTVNDQVSAVPVPAAGWLFGSGLLGLLGISKRMKTA